jgi:transposase InsO family protein
MGISRTTAYRWWRRYRTEGLAGLRDRSSRPHRSPNQTPARVEERIVRLRRTRKLGPARIGLICGVPASTVHRVLVRHGLNRLAWMDRPTGRVIRRYEKDHPGELLHVDIKKIGQIPPGGGWWAHGRGQVKPRRVGYAFLHVAIDDHSRLAYVEAHDDEKADTTAGFLHRAVEWFWTRGMVVDAVMTDNGSAYRSHLVADVLASRAIAHWFTRPYRPQTNGKVERFIRTLMDECAYARVYRSEHARRKAIDRYVHIYNHHRHHTAIGGPPINRAPNLSGQHT